LAGGDADGPMYDNALNGDGIYIWNINCRIVQFFKPNFNILHDGNPNFLGLCDKIFA